MENPEQNIGRKIKRISSALEARRTRSLAELELTSSQSMVLAWLTKHRQESPGPADVGRRFGMTLPTVTGILQRLEAKGFLRLEPDCRDRRKKNITVTGKALELEEQILQRIRTTEATVRIRLTEEEQETLLALLDKVAVALECGETGQSNPEEVPND